MSHDLISKTNFIVEWNQINYNIGNHFDGTIFTAPKTGLYYFSATVQMSDTSSFSQFLVNDQERFFSRCYTQDNQINSLSLQKTFKLETDDKVEVRLHGKLYEASWSTRASFEGRFISKIDD